MVSSKRIANDRRGASFLAASALVCMAACGHDASPAPSTERPAASRSHDETHGEVSAPSPALPPARLSRVEGTAEVGTQPAVLGGGVERGADVRLDTEGRVDLDLLVGARASLRSPGALALATAPDDGVWVSSGVAYIADPPGGVGARAPLRVATPTLTLELQGAADVVVAVDGAGATHVAVVSGRVLVSTGEVDARHRLRTFEVVAGQQVQSGEHLEEPTANAGRLDECITAARALLSADTEAPSLNAPMARLDEALRWIEIEQRHGVELTQRHRAAVQASRPDEAMQFQREIVAHAQAVHGLRQVVLTRWERLAVAARASSVAPNVAHEVDVRLDRVRSLLES